MLPSYPDAALSIARCPIPLGPCDAQLLGAPGCHDRLRSNSQRTRDFTTKHAAGTPPSVLPLRHWLNRYSGFTPSAPLTAARSARRAPTLRAVEHSSIRARLWSSPHYLITCRPRTKTMLLPRRNSVASTTTIWLPNNNLRKSRRVRERRRTQMASRPRATQRIL